MSLIDTLQSYKTRGMVVLVMLTAVWAYKVFLDIQHSNAGIENENAYQICIAGDQSDCPKESAYAACGATLSSLAKESCERYSLKTISNSFGGQCGVSVIEIACL